MKTCSSCKEIKEFNEFHRSSKSKDNYQSRCKICNKEQRKEYYKTAIGKNNNLDAGRRQRHKNRTKLIEYLKSHPCIRCGETDIVVLEFDHRDPNTKVANISKLVRNSSWKKIQEEIDKCDVLCANDHKRRTADQFGWLKAQE